jgi:hypothetical protein
MAGRAGRLARGLDETINPVGCESVKDPAGLLVRRAGRVVLVAAAAADTTDLVDVLRQMVTDAAAILAVKGASEAGCYRTAAADRLIAGAVWTALEGKRQDFFHRGAI